MESHRFVVLRHEPGTAGPSALHWDLMLEFGDSLRTWALRSEPHVGATIPADELPRHRTDYLDYEGPVSQGRGTVSRLDRGTFEIVQDAPEQLALNLHGGTLVGRLELTRDDANQCWTARLTSN